MSFKKLPNLELILYMAKLELAVHHDSWQAIIDEKKAKNRFVRPDFAVQVFPQMWGNTCTGFDITWDGEPTIAGQAMTEEYTTVVHERVTGFYCVFFGELICYVVSYANEAFLTDLKNHNMACRSEANKRY
ncbi:MAG: hypothetical protein OSJ54_06305 [Oscillospiraceae bacterium]|nr:hypothetical protein [Oscillospiraceae bacterium]